MGLCGFTVREGRVSCCEGPVAVAWWMWRARGDSLSYGKCVFRASREWSVYVDEKGRSLWVGRSDETRGADIGSRKAKTEVRGSRFNDARSPITVLEGTCNKTAAAVQW